MFGNRIPLTETENTKSTNLSWFGGKACEQCDFQAPSGALTAGLSFPRTSRGKRDSQAIDQRTHRRFFPEQKMVAGLAEQRFG